MAVPALLLVFFETWARLDYGVSFLLNGYNLQSIALSAAMPLLLGLGQTFVIIAGGIDLSVGFVMGLASVVMARVMQTLTPGRRGAGPGGRPARGAPGRAAPGAINGTLISRLRVPAFIGTLGMYGVARGAGFLAANGTTVPVNNPLLFALGNGKLLGVPVPVVVTVAAGAGDALGAVADPLRPAHLRDRRQPHGGGPRRHQHPPPHAPALPDQRRLRRRRRHDLHRPLLRRAPRRAASRCCSIRSPPW